MRLGKRKELRASILDRLLDDEPHNNLEADARASQRVNDLRRSVKRDLESLLNTRYRMVAPPEAYTQLEQSLLNYGMPDLATVNIISVEKKNAFIKNLERILRDYEPRFKSVKVVAHENRDRSDRTLRFRIEATLYADPAPEIVIFDSELDPVSRVVNVEDSSNG